MAGSMRTFVTDRRTDIQTSEGRVDLKCAMNEELKLCEHVYVVEKDA